MTGADTCRKFVVPLLQQAGWDTEPYSIAEQRIAEIMGNIQKLLKE